MKIMKKISALVIAMVMVLAMALPAMAADGHKITINQKSTDKATHVYGAYQIFGGTVDTTSGQLKNIVWGSNVDIDQLGTFASELNAMRDTVNPEFEALTANSIAAAFAEAIGKLDANNSDTAMGQAIAESISKILKGNPATGQYTTANEVYVIEGLTDGYYFVQDTVDPAATESSANSGAKTRYILSVVGADVTVTEKADVPSVDKQVADNNDGTTPEGYDNNGFGESADHAINESFQFKLTATIPADVDLPKYDSYKAIFTDTMSVGVTFESIDSVKIKVGEADATVVSADQYTLSDNIYANGAFKALDGAASWTLTFADILPLISDKTKTVAIEVVYNAHLNKDATTFDEDATNDAANNNKVKLTYSNNPNANGNGETGETKEDTVFVFTYNVDDTKYSEEVKQGNELPGAGFTLYESDGTTVVNLIWEASKEAYRPATTAEIAAEGYTAEMTSQSNGKFNIIGVDAGTYILKETTVPAGYNPAEDVTIEIVAKHKENTSTVGADLSLENSSNLDNNVLNLTGTVLPSTGGIGTTIFYVIGGILVVLAGVVLVTKRKSAE